MHFLADQVRIFAKCLREVGGNGVIDGCVEEIGPGCMVFFRFAVQLFPKFCSSNVSSVRNNRQLSNQATTMRCVLIRCFAFDSRRRGGRKGIWSRHEIRAVQVAMQVASVAPTLILKKDPALGNHHSQKLSSTLAEDPTRLYVASADSGFYEP